MTITGITSPNDSKADSEESRPRWKVRWADTERWEELRVRSKKKKKKKGSGGKESGMRDNHGEEGRKGDIYTQSEIRKETFRQEVGWRR